MSYRIEEIEGIGPANAQKLARAKISTTGQLLAACASAAGRASVSAATGVSAATLLKWADMADLMRIKGIGRQYGELLKAVGVDTVKELKMRRADNLAQAMREINAKKRLCKVVPGARVVQGWIDSARATPPLISH